MEKVYIITIEKTFDYSSNETEVFAFVNKTDAKKKFNEMVEQEKNFVEENEWEGSVQGKDYFTAYDESYATNHINVELRTVKLL